MMKGYSIPEIFTIIREAAEELIPKANNLGLLNGKMGAVLFFYHLSKKTGFKDCERFASSTLNQIYKDIETKFIPIDFENGLSGIAWGIEHLKQAGYINSPNNEILDKIDDRIYQHIGYSDEGPIGLLDGDLGYLLYILTKLNGRKEQKEPHAYSLYERLMIELINRVYDKIESQKITLKEPSAFKLDWDLPTCLWLMGEAAKTTIYNEKIERILDQLSPVVLSFFPHLHSNRLNLCVGMLSLLQNHKQEGWQEHTNQLIENISLKKILQQELYKQNIHYLDGMAGISALSRKMNELDPKSPLMFHATELIEAIATSPFWNNLENDILKRNNVGLLSGLMGVGLELIYLEKCSQQDVNVDYKSEFI